MVSGPPDSRTLREFRKRAWVMSCVTGELWKLRLVPNIYIYICSPPPRPRQYMTFVYVVNMLRGGALDAADDHANPVGIESLF